MNPNSYSHKDAMNARPFRCGSSSAPTTPWWLSLLRSRLATAAPVIPTAEPARLFFRVRRTLPARSGGISLRLWLRSWLRPRSAYVRQLPLPASLVFVL